MTKSSRREEHRRGLLSDVAISKDGIGRLNAGLREDREKLIDRLELAFGVSDFGEGNALRSGNVAEFRRAATLRWDAVVEGRGARIDDGHARLGGVSAHVVRVDYDRAKI